MELFGHKLKLETRSGSPWVHGLPISGAFLQLSLMKRFDKLKAPVVQTETIDKKTTDRFTITNNSGSQHIVERERSVGVDVFRGRGIELDGAVHTMGHREILQAITRALTLPLPETAEIASPPAASEPAAVIHTAEQV